MMFSEDFLLTERASGTKNGVRWSDFQLIMTFKQTKDDGLQMDLFPSKSFSLEEKYCIVFYKLEVF